MHPTEIKRIFDYNYKVILETVAKKGLDIDIQGVIRRAQKLTLKYVEGLEGAVNALTPNKTRQSECSSPSDPRKHKHHDDEFVQFCRSVGKAVLGENTDPFNVNPW